MIRRPDRPPPPPWLPAGAARRRTADHRASRCRHRRSRDSRDVGEREQAGGASGPRSLDVPDARDDAAAPARRGRERLHPGDRGRPRHAQGGRKRGRRGGRDGLFALAVAHPTAGNLGGGARGSRLRAGRPRARLPRDAPAAASRDMYGSGDGAASDAGAHDPKAGSSRDGWRSSGTPASVAGLWALQGERIEAVGRGDRPAIAMAAATGLSSTRARERDRRPEELLGQRSRLHRAVPPRRRPPKVGATWKNPDLARVLERIAAKGPTGFTKADRRGEIAAEMKAHGGLITLGDLRAYEWGEVAGRR